MNNKPIKTTSIRAGKHNLTSKRASQLVKQGRQDIQDEIKLLLVKHDLTLDNILLKYKELLDSKHEMPKASDIVKVLENLTRLNNIETEQAQQVKNLIVMFQDKSNTEIVQYLGELTSKTQEYISEISEQNHVKIKTG